MAKEPKAPTGFTTDAPPARVDTEIAQDRSLSVDAGAGNVAERNAGSVEVDMGDIEQIEEDDGAPAAETPSEEPEAETSEETPEAEDLGDYDGTEEARAKFDKKYMTEPKDGLPGQLKRDVLAQEFWAGQAKAGKDAKDFGHMSEATYKYLEDTFAVDRQMIHDYEAGLVAQSKLNGQQFFSKIDGGEKAYRGAIEWAKGGGYTEAQRARFNELQKKGGDDFDDAVEALMVRARRANPNGFPAPRAPQQQDRRGRRGSAPRRDVSGSAGSAPAGGGEAYTPEQHQVAWQEALRNRTAAKNSGDRQKVREAERALDKLQDKARKAFGNRR